MSLLAFPCSRELAALFCEKLSVEGSAAVILQKQEPILRDLFTTCGIRDVYALPEAFYGGVTSPDTKRALMKIRERGFKRAYFPLNDFSGNVALLLAALAPEVIAVNATSFEHVELRLSDRDILPAPLSAGPDPRVKQIQAMIVKQLETFTLQIREMATGDRAGERPTQGLVENYPYDCEVLSRYVYAGGQARGNVLEVGCGLGYGAYLMAELNPEIRVTAVDNDARAIELATEMWGDNDRLVFELAQAEALPFRDDFFDTAVSFEVIEHLADPRVLLSEAGRTLDDGGMLIGSTPNSRLFPYRVKNDQQGTPDDLRRVGVWPWHVQELDEAAVSALMAQHGFGTFSISYPTFVRGIDLYQIIRRSSLPMAIEQLSRLSWSAADFAALDTFYPCFSGFSFVFSGVKTELYPIGRV